MGAANAPGGGVHTGQRERGHCVARLRGRAQLSVQTRTMVRALESLIFGVKHAKTLVRFAHKTFNNKPS